MVTGCPLCLIWFFITVPPFASILWHTSLLEASCVTQTREMAHHWAYWWKPDEVSPLKHRTPWNGGLEETGKRGKLTQAGRQSIKAIYHLSPCCVGDAVGCTMKSIVICHSQLRICVLLIQKHWEQCATRRKITWHFHLPLPNSCIWMHFPMAMESLLQKTPQHEWRISK